MILSSSTTYITHPEFDPVGNDLDVVRNHKARNSNNGADRRGDKVHQTLHAQLLVQGHGSSILEMLEPSPKKASPPPHLAWRPWLPTKMIRNIK
jgi:hypothetical protein